MLDEILLGIDEQNPHPRVPANHLRAKELVSPPDFIPIFEGNEDKIAHFGKSLGLIDWGRSLADDPRRYAHRDGVGGQIMSYHGICADDGVVSDRDSGDDGDFTSEPDVFANPHRDNRHSLFPDANIGVFKTMVVVSNGDHLRDQAVIADNDFVQCSNRAVVAEDRSRAHLKASPAFNGQVIVEDTAITEDHFGAARLPEAESAA